MKRPRSRREPMKYHDVPSYPGPPVAPPPRKSIDDLMREIIEERDAPKPKDELVELMERIAKSNEQVVELLSSIEARLDELAHGD